MWCCFTVGGLGLSLPFEEVFHYNVAKSYRNNFNETKSNQIQRKISEKPKKHIQHYVCFVGAHPNVTLSAPQKNSSIFFLYILLDDEDESDLHEKT
jgi:hypothetical protein